jgi:hypothetical protein
MFRDTEEYPGVDEQCMAEKYGVAVFRNIHLSGTRPCRTGLRPLDQRALRAFRQKSRQGHHGD